MNFLELIKTGGWIMYPLVILSVVAWVVCLERYLALKSWKHKNRSFLLSFQNFWLKNDVTSAKKLCEINESDVAEVAREFFNSGAQMKMTPKVRAKMDRKRLEQATDLKKNLWLLGTIGSASPFLGLFGTVIGIIKAFESMASSGAGGFNTVAAGISEALIATASGIIVAVITIFFYNYFQVKVGQLQFRLRLYTEELVEILEGDAESSVKTG